MDYISQINTAESNFVYVIILVLPVSFLEVGHKPPPKLREALHIESLAGAKSGGSGLNSQKKCTWSDLRACQGAARGRQEEFDHFFINFGRFRRHFSPNSFCWTRLAAGWA